MLTFLELQEALRSGGFDIARLDFVVCNAGAYIMSVHADGKHWVSDEAWEANVGAYWDKQLVKRTLVRMTIQNSRSNNKEVQDCSPMLVPARLCWCLTVA